MLNKMADIGTQGRVHKEAERGGHSNKDSRSKSPCYWITFLFASDLTAPPLLYVKQRNSLKSCIDSDRAVQDDIADTIFKYGI